MLSDISAVGLNINLRLKIFPGFFRFVQCKSESSSFKPNFINKETALRMKCCFNHNFFFRFGYYITLPHKTVHEKSF